MDTISRLVGTLILIGFPLATTSCGSTTRSPTKTQVELPCVGDSLAYRPGSLLLACGDGNLSVEDIRWSAWEGNFAAGIGTVLANLCQPDCARGRTSPFTAHLVLTGLRTMHGRNVFTSLVIDYGSRAPYGVQVQIIDLSAG